MELLSPLEVLEEYIQAAARIVSELPRGIDSSGKAYRGVFYSEVMTAFYREFKNLAVNPSCSLEKPCGSCKRDVFQETVRIAESRGLIVSKVWGPKFEKGSNGRLFIHKRGYRKLYRPDEITHKDLDIDWDRLDLILANSRWTAPSMKELLTKANAEKNVTTWNRWKSENPENPLNLAGMDLTGLDLRGIDLSHSKLSGAILASGTFSNADFHSANLIATNLNGAILDGSNFERANLSEAILCKANLRRANLVNANLNKGNLLGADLTEADLSEANLSRSNLRSADLRKAKLDGADLTDAMLYGAVFDMAFLMKLAEK